MIETSAIVAYYVLMNVNWSNLIAVFKVLEKAQWETDLLSVVSMRAEMKTATEVRNGHTHTMCFRRSTKTRRKKHSQHPKILNLCVYGGIRPKIRTTHSSVFLSLCFFY